MTRPERVYTDEERRLLLRAAHGHWCGFAVRWLLDTGCSRAELCALTWADITHITETEPDDALGMELHLRRKRAAEEAELAGTVFGRQPVFPGHYGQRMRPDQLRDTFRRMMRDRLALDARQALDALATRHAMPIGDTLYARGTVT